MNSPKKLLGNNSFNMKLKTLLLLKSCYLVAEFFNDIDLDFSFLAVCSVFTLNDESRIFQKSIFGMNGNAPIILLLNRNLRNVIFVMNISDSHLREIVWHTMVFVWHLYGYELLVISGRSRVVERRSHGGQGLLLLAAPRRDHSTV